MMKITIIILALLLGSCAKEDAPAVPEPVLNFDLEYGIRHKMHGALMQITFEAISDYPFTGAMLHLNGEAHQLIPNYENVSASFAVQPQPVAYKVVLNTGGIEMTHSVNLITTDTLYYHAF